MREFSLKFLVSLHANLWEQGGILYLPAAVAQLVVRCSFAAIWCQIGDEECRRSLFLLSAYGSSKEDKSIEL